MCGIVGCVGKIDVKNFLIQGLKDLDYRGYDSAGVAYLLNREIVVHKFVGSVENLSKKTPSKFNSDVGIGHTRWATHGVPSDINSHPHVSNDGTFALVHNGVIKNYKNIKGHLSRKGYSFLSETDTEVIVNLLQRSYGKTNDVLEAIRLTVSKLEGGYACAFITSHEPHRLYFFKNSAPLLIGVGEGFNLLASDASPMITETHKFIELDDLCYGYIEEKDLHIYKDGNELEPVYTEKQPDLLKRDLCGYPHFMLKEIEEIPTVIGRLVDNYYNDGEFNFDPKLIEAIHEADHIVFIACGTSYHASLIGAHYFERLGKDASVFIASEWAYYPKYLGKKPLYVFLSQSGETADLIRCGEAIKAMKMPLLVITNTKGSTLERMSTYSCLLYAGLEVAVASTKAYSAMVTLLSLLSRACAHSTHIAEKLNQIIEDCNKIIERKEEIREIAKKIKDAKNVFFLGRGYDYEMSLEASLKLKEITYIHSEGVPGGELKHGPIALIEEGVPVITFISDPVTESAMRGNVEEVNSRGAISYIVSSNRVKRDGDAFVVPDSVLYLSPLLKSMFAFYLAYYVSLEKGLNVDKPRNLAKSVTVE